MLDSKYVKCDFLRFKLSIAVILVIALVSYISFQYTYRFLPDVWNVSYLRQNTLKPFWPFLSLLYSTQSTPSPTWPSTSSSSTSARWPTFSYSKHSYSTQATSQSGWRLHWRVKDMHLWTSSESITCALGLQMIFITSIGSVVMQWWLIVKKAKYSDHWQLILLTALMLLLALQMLDKLRLINQHHQRLKWARY